MRNAILIFVFAAFLSAQEKPVTVEWIYSGEAAKIASVPKYTWLSDNSILLYDSRKPASERSFEKMDPKTGKRTPFLDMAKAKASLTALLNRPMQDSIGWPLAWSSDGQRALYVWSSDVFILNASTSTFTRITQTPEMEIAPRLSPNGLQVGYVRNNDLYVYDLGKSTEMRLTSDGSETLLNGKLSWVYWEEVFDREELGYWWSDDGRKIAFLQTDESKVSVMTFPDFKPAVPSEIKQRYPKTGGINPTVRMGISDLASKAVTWVDLNGIAYEYIVRAGWLPDGRLYVQTMNRMQTELDLYFVEAATGKPTWVLKETDPGWVRETNDFYFIKNGKQFIWASQRDGFTHLYRYDISGKQKNQITKGSWSVNPSGLYSPGGIVGIDEKNEWIYFQALEKSSIERHLYRIGFDGAKMTRLSKENGTHNASFSSDGLFYVENFSSGASLPGLYLKKNDGTIAQTIAAPRPELLTPFAPRFPEFLNIPARDGFPLPAQILKPAGFDPNKKYPLIIYVYGGPSAPSVSDSWGGSRFWFHQILLREGYLVMHIDNRSATAISKTLENTVARQQASDGELNDLVDAVQWLKKQTYVDPERVGVYGWSGGGTFTLLLMTRSQEFKAGISGAPVTSWDYYDTKYGEASMKTPQSNPDGYARTNLTQYAKNLHGRLLMIHGTYDDNVHPQNTWHFADELIKANILFDMMIYPMRKHGFTDIPAQIHLYNKMLEFWKKNL